MPPSARSIGPFVRALLSGGWHRGSRRFATGRPTPQTAIDSAPAPWASRLPLPDTTAGQADLFNDPRVAWGIDALGGVREARCVELGPLEGGHSCMLERAGASEIVGVEANRDAYLKCLIVKELLGLSRCRFLCGDVVGYLEATDTQFDVCWCSGVLYHMTDPIGLLELISARASRLFMWTHYYDAAFLSDARGKGRGFANLETTASHDGFTYRLHRHEYGMTTRLGAFWGGTQTFSNWLTLDDLLGALEHFGWRDIRTQRDEPHVNGPAVSLVAVRA